MLVVGERYPNRRTFAATSRAALLQDITGENTALVPPQAMEATTSTVINVRQASQGS